MTTSWKPLLISSAGVLLFVGVLMLLTPSPASAQCGSQASSCKNCHEVQGQDPVNTEGDWHISHAFGDFCQFCHAGNVQAIEAETAHQSMVAPLADPVASCGACHPADARDLAVVYGTALGIDIETSGSGPAASSPTAVADQPCPPAAVDVAASLPAADIIDYNTQYAQTVEGQGELQPGNLILGALLTLIVVGGGAFVLRNERRRRQTVSEDSPGAPVAAKPPKSAAPAENAPHFAPRTAGASATGAAADPSDLHSASPAPGLPADGAAASALLPAIASLDPAGRHALEQLLQDAETASDLFRRLARLDPKMLHTLRSLDQNTRELLLALSKD
jgi:hypothetical protein